MHLLDTLGLIVRVTVVKLGCIASTALLESLLDERASREDIVIRSFSSGTKMDTQSAREVEAIAASVKSDIFLVVSPNASLEEPKLLVKNLAKKAPTVIVSDAPARKAVQDFEKSHVGYIIIEADSLIGVRKEFLDPIEMALFNSDVIRVLAVTGAFRVLHEEIDKVIESVKRRKTWLPKLIVNKDVAIKRGEFSNPYAKAKAMASFEMARLAGQLSAEGAYKVKERERYLTIVASAHELMREAALLADQAREIGKTENKVSRHIHFNNGTTKMKKGLFDNLR
jgi:methylenetetrahydromethanopterin dehydrogenase